MMKLKKLMLSVLILGSVDFSCTAMFEKGDRCKVVSGYLKEWNEIIVIEGTCKEVFNISNTENLAKNEHLWEIPALADYLTICLQGIRSAPAPSLLKVVASCSDRIFVKDCCNGIFYYGKLDKSGYRVCLHPSWLEKIKSE